MSWIKKLIPARISTEGKGRGGVPEGLWVKCEDCTAVLYRAEVERSHEVCPKCGFHMRIGARRRLSLFLDEDNRTEIGADLEPVDFLKFKDTKRYRDRISAATKLSGEKDAMVAISGELHGLPVVATAFEYLFISGSMGAVVGEKFYLAAQCAQERGAALVCFSASGGARMQEALVSLMQMAKTSSALAQLSAAKLPFISVLCHPTTGGVSASLAMLGDILIAEPKAQIGFAGPRVIEQTVRETLPDGFQRAEFLLEHGSIDQIIDRRAQRDRIAGQLAMLLGRPRPETLPTALPA